MNSKSNGFVADGADRLTRALRGKRRGLWGHFLAFLARRRYASDATLY